MFSRVAERIVEPAEVMDPQLEPCSWSLGWESEVESASGS